MFKVHLTHRCHNIICPFAFCKERQETKRLTSDNIDISIIMIIIMPKTETNVIQALMRTFLIAGSRSKGEPVTPPATRALVTASEPSSAERGKLSTTGVTN